MKELPSRGRQQTASKPSLAIPMEIPVRGDGAIAMVPPPLPGYAPGSVVRQLADQAGTP